jgi:hypothetical protein
LENGSSSNSSCGSGASARARATRCCCPPERLAEVLEVDQFQQLFGHAILLRMLANAEGDVVGHAQVREQRVVLEHHADAAFLRGEGEAGAGDGLAGQLDFAFVYRFETGNRPQSGGFAAAGRAQQATDVTAFKCRFRFCTTRWS